MKSHIQLFRNCIRRGLRDVDFLEHILIPILGLNNEELREYPSSLLPFCGTGLMCWQYPNQLAPYLVTLSHLGIQSYLEVGVRKGGTFVVTVEYLSQFSEVSPACGVDVAREEINLARKYLEINPRVVFHRVSSHGKEFKEIAKFPFDLVLIDGDHSAEGVREDFETVRGTARCVAFHDIVSDVVPGVGQVWNEVKCRFSSTHDFKEFVDQYPEVVTRTKQRFMGIGLMVPK